MWFPWVNGRVNGRGNGGSSGRDDRSAPPPATVPDTRNVIELQDATKLYSLYRTPAARLRQALGRGEAPAGHVALDGIRLAIRRGESVGILGVNGAGKSTMLGLIAGTTTPTRGTAAVHGSVAALLELGAGFNPAWTGRQNVEFQARIAGVSPRELAGYMAKTEEFADIGHFFEQPMQIYSNGMFLRVAFAAAIMCEPQILIIDEVLAVGDTRFQTKCFARIESFRQQGRTVLFVTHAPELVSRLCTRGIILDRGRIVFDGAPAEATRRYLTALYAPPAGDGLGATDAPSGAAEPSAAAEPLAHEADDLTPAGPPALCDATVEQRPFYNPYERRTGDKRGSIVDVSFTAGMSDEVNLVRSGDEVGLAVRLRIERDIPRPTIGLVIRTVDNVAVYGSSTAMQSRAFKALPGGSEAIAHLRFSARLVPGEYFLDIGFGDVVAEKQEAVDFRLGLIHFVVTGQPTSFGIADLEGRFELVA